MRVVSGVTRQILERCWGFLVVEMVGCREREREREVVEDTTSLDGLVIPTMLNCYLANAKLPALIDVLPT